jgi:hypothetical protein
MDISRILQSFNMIEGRTSPVSTKSGLTSQQKSVDQLPALFRPKKIAVLTNKTDPQHPTAGHFVGDDIDVAQTPLEEAMRSVEEDMISKTRNDLRQYLDMLANKTQENNELLKKAQAVIEKNLDSDSVPVEEDPTETEPNPDPPESSSSMQSDSGSIPIKTITLENGKILEIHGDENQGFRLGLGDRFIDRQFKNIDDAVMAVDIYRSRKNKSQQSGDYIEER